jgi:serine/threonine-protein kinase
VSLISLAIFTIVLLSFLLMDPLIPGPTPLDLALLGLVVAVLAVQVIVLWRRRPQSMRMLRIREGILFGIPAVFFGWVQHAVFVQVAAKHYPGEVIWFAVGADALRWVILIVLYGTFIPNTWRRCASITGAMAVTPLMLLIIIFLTNAPLTPHLPQVLPEMILCLLTGTLIAVFGSYKISVLHQQAYEARKLGQYQLKRLLGRGGMGEVYLGVHLLLRRPCAIKLIRPEQAGDPRNLARFEREVQATATLTHWNTVEIYDYGHAADGTFYYVMEYLPGMSLQDLVEKYGPLAPERVIYLLRQVCGALREAHAIGLIHRNIKPSNIITCERGAIFDVAKLLDFGIVQGGSFANDDGRLTQEGAIAGSPQYLSPEQATGTAMDARSDIYSLGGVAYFLLTGQTPFIRETALEMIMAHVCDPVQPLTRVRADVPLDLQDVVLRCLEKDPAKRFLDANSLAYALIRCHCASRWTTEQAAAWWREHPIQNFQKAEGSEEVTR